MCVCARARAWVCERERGMQRKAPYLPEPKARVTRLSHSRTCGWIPFEKGRCATDKNRKIGRITPSLLTASDLTGNRRRAACIFIISYTTRSPALRTADFLRSITDTLYMRHVYIAVITTQRHEISKIYMVHQCRLYFMDFRGVTRPTLIRWFQFLSEFPKYSLSSSVLHYDCRWFQKGTMLNGNLKIRKQSNEWKNETSRIKIT